MKNQKQLGFMMLLNIISYYFVYCCLANISYFDLSNLIYWCEDDLTPEQIIDMVSNYKSIQL